MKKHDWKKEYNPIRRNAKRLLSGDTLADGPLSDLIELDEYHRKLLMLEASLIDWPIDTLQEIGLLCVTHMKYGKSCPTVPYH